MGVSFDEWLRRRRLASESTIATYEACIRRLERHAGVCRDELRTEHLETFLRNGYSPATKEVTLVAYRTRQRWGALQGKWVIDPELFEIRLPKRRVRVKPALTVDQACALIARAQGPIEKRTFLVGLYTGLRLSEIVSIDNRSWAGSVISVMTKGDWPLQIPVHPELMEARDEILSAVPSRKQVQGACHKLRAAVGVPITPHWMRRTFSQRLRKLGVDRSVIGALLGHSAENITTEYYVPATWEEMVEAISVLHYNGLTGSVSPRRLEGRLLGSPTRGYG